jgi:hypothetical protein
MNTSLVKLLFFLWILVLATGCNDVSNDNIVSNVSPKKWYSSAPLLSAGLKINLCDSTRMPDYHNPYNVDSGEIKHIGLVTLNDNYLVLFSRVSSANEKEIFKTPSLNVVVFDNEWHKTDSLEITGVDLYSYIGTDSWNCPLVKIHSNKVTVIRNEGFMDDQWIDSLEMNVGEEGNLQLIRYKKNNPI